MSPLDRPIIDLALAGDDDAVRQLIEALTPVVQARVARILLRWRGEAAGRELRQEMQDMVQEVFTSLFENRGAVLRAWDPARGLSLQNFIGLVAERQTAALLRTGKRNPWKEDPTEAADMDRFSTSDGNTAARGTAETSPESRAISRQALEYLIERLTEELSPLGRRIFELLFVEQHTAQEVCAEMQMTSEAVWAWRSRLGRRAREILTDSMSGESSARPRPRVAGAR